MDKLNTVDSILEALEKMAQVKDPVDAHTWLQGCSKLLALLGNEQNDLFDLESKIAILKLQAMEAGETASKAKVRAEATEDYTKARKLKAKIERCFEIIRVSKLMSRMSHEEMQSHR